MSIGESADLTNLMAKLIPEETSTIFSESDYVIDLSSWFQDSINKKRYLTCIRQLKIKTVFI